MKYRVHTKNSNVVIKGKLALGEKVNERELDYLLKNAVPGFFKISYDGKKQFTYEASGCISLEKYLKEKKLEEPSFWKVMAQMLDVGIAAKNRGLYPAHLLMKPDAVFIEERTLKMYFAYQPVIGAKDMTDNLFALIHDIIYQEMKKNGGTGPDYLLDFQHYLGQGDYRPEHVRQYIGQAFTKGHAPDIGRGVAIQAENGGEAPDTGQYTVMLGSGGNAGQPQAQKSAEKCIRLFRIRTGEQTALPGNVVKMGRSSQNTYCIPGNASIGRNHAAIVRRGDACYLKDMGSVNGTSVNGKRLAQNQACVLQSGDRILLADEEFVFELK